MFSIGAEVTCNRFSSVQYRGNEEHVRAEDCRGRDEHRERETGATCTTMSGLFLKF